jgi:SH3-like domain-containing protein
MLKVTDFKQFLLAVLIVSFPNAKQHYIHADVANIRDKPSGNKTAQLNINTPVQIQQEQNEWCFIIGPENISGWVHKTYNWRSCFERERTQRFYQCIQR